jgi:hypothetical protein
MAVTHKLIQTVTVGSGGAASIAFTSIPGTYTDLKLVLSTRSSAGTASWSDYVVSFNSTSTSSNFAARALYGAGSGTPTSTSFTNSYLGVGEGNGGTASIFGSTEFYIPNYASSNNKPVSVDSVSENNAAASLITIVAGLWSNSSAITSISITDFNGGNFVQHSSASLYGIKNS